MSLINKELSKKSNNPLETYYAIQIGTEIINKIGKVPELKGIYKKIHKIYCEEVIDKEINILKKEFEDKDISDYIMELEDEKIKIEIFLRWVSDDTMFELVKK